MNATENPIRSTFDNTDCYSPSDVIARVAESASVTLIPELVEFAECGTPAKNTGSGVDLLRAFRDRIVQDWRESADEIIRDWADPSEWDYCATMLEDLDLSEQIDKACDLETGWGVVPSATRDIWDAFVDLDAMHEMPNMTKEIRDGYEYKTVPRFDNMTEVAVAALGDILERLGDALRRDMNTRAAQYVSELSDAWLTAHDTAE